MNIDALRVLRKYSLPITTTVFITAMIAGTQPVVAQEACLNDIAQFPNATCRASDVRISQINVTDGPVECIAGLPVEIKNLQAELLGGAFRRYDIGMYLGTDGGDAKVSISGNKDGCTRDFLPIPPYDDFDFDACGDIPQGETVTKELEDLTLTCIDSDDDGFLDVGTCLSWDNNTKDMCSSVDDAIPGTPSKCRCEPIQVGEITVIPSGTIIVEKKIFGHENDPDVSRYGKFVFTGDVEGEIEGNETISVTGLPAGPYTSTELESELTPFLVDIDCDDDDSTGNPGARTAMFNVAEGETVTCTFTNSPGG